jgi:hypothetical protein
MLVRWLVYLHVLAAITFFLLHGASAAMAFRVRRERDFNRIRAMLDLSWGTTIPMGIAFLVLAATGVILPFLVHIWDRGYIWVSIVLMVGVFVYMSVFNEGHFKELRRLVGLPYMKGNKEYPAEPPASQAAVEALLERTSIAGLMVAGYIVPAIVLWLMLFKPF